MKRRRTKQWRKFVFVHGDEPLSRAPRWGMSTVAPLLKRASEIMRQQEAANAPQQVAQ